MIQAERIKLGFIFMAACLACALVYVMNPEEHTLIPCLFHKLSGYECAGCGLTRATHHVLHGNWSAAWQRNPLVFIVLPAFAYSFLARCAMHFTQRKWVRFSDSALVSKLSLACILVFMIVRNVH